MSSVTLIVHGIGIVDQNPLIDHGRDRFVDHRTRDSIFQESLFDRLLTESILIPVSVLGSDITGDCLIGPGLEFGIGLFGCFSRESLVICFDLRGFHESERDEFFDGCCLSYLIGHIVSMILGDND